MMDLRWIFFVVIAGNPDSRLNLICYPNALSVPLPVRSDFGLPFSRTYLIRSRYCFISPSPMRHRQGSWPKSLEC